MKRVEIVSHSIPVLGSARLNSDDPIASMGNRKGQLGLIDWNHLLAQNDNPKEEKIRKEIEHGMNIHRKKIFSGEEEVRTELASRKKIWVIKRMEVTATTSSLTKDFG